MIFHMLEVPVWANRLVIILMALGFPAVTIFAWVYEITPEGLKPTAEIPHGQSIRRQTGQRLNRAIIAVLALALGYFVIDKFWLSKRSATESVTAPVAAESSAAVPTVPPISDKSIAVLPFTDMSEKKDQEYFADGMAEEILDILAKIPAIKVIGRTSSFQFKGKNENLRAIGKQLGAGYVLEGSVRKSGNKVRITAQLIEAQSGTHRWSDTYERDVGDVLKLQDDIAVKLQQAGLIQYARGHITVLDRAGLEKRSCECYAVVKNEYARLLPGSRPRSGMVSGSRYANDRVLARSSYVIDTMLLAAAVLLAIIIHHYPFARDRDGLAESTTR